MGSFRQAVWEEWWLSAPPPPSFCVALPEVAPKKREEGEIEREYLKANTFPFLGIVFKKIIIIIKKIRHCNHSQSSYAFF